MFQRYAWVRDGREFLPTHKNGRAPRACLKMQELKELDKQSVHLKELEKQE